MFRSTLVISLLALVASGISFANQLVLARFFGTSFQMDMYLLAISLPLMICGLLGGVLGYLLVPALMRAEAEQGASDGLLQALVWGLGGGAVVVGLAFAAGAGWMIHAINGALPGREYALATEVARVAWLWVPLAVLGSTYTAALHVRLRFVPAAIFAWMPMLGALTGCLAAHSVMGVKAVAVGQLLGYGVMVAGLRLSLGRVGTGRDWSDLRKVLAEFPLALAALLLFVIYPFSDAFWGSRVGPSVVSYLGYGQRLTVGISGLIVTGATTVIFPRLARQAAQGEAHAMRFELARSVRTMLLCVAPMATIGGVLALPMIQFLFQRGAFSLANARGLAGFLPFMFLGMVAMSCMGLVYKALFAQGARLAAAVLSLGGSAAYFLLSGLLGRHFGVRGIGMAYAIAWWLVFAVGLRYLWRETAPRHLLSVGAGFAARLLAACLLSGALCWIGRRWLPPPTAAAQLDRLLVAAIITAVASAAYLVAGNTVLVTDEMKLIMRRTRELVRRNR